MKKTLALTVPLAVLLAGLALYQYGPGGAIGAFSRLEAVKELQEEKIRGLEKYDALIARRPQLEKRLDAVRKERNAGVARLIQGETPSIAAAALQETIRDIITGRGGQITSQRSGRLDDLGKFKVINVSFDMVVPDSAALSDILYSIETHPVYLVIRELDARVRNFREPKELMVRLDVSALTGGAK